VITSECRHDRPETTRKPQRRSKEKEGVGRFQSTHQEETKFRGDHKKNAQMPGGWENKSSERRLREGEEGTR